MDGSGAKALDKPKTKVDTELELFKANVTGSNEQECEDITIWINKQVILNQESRNNNTKKLADPQKHHPIKPLRGEVYMAEMGINVGVEFKDYHPVIILQNDKGNLYSETTIVIPMTGIEAGEKLDPIIHFKITNYDFESVEKSGLDKNPSKIKLADITTIDKARLKTKVGKLKSTFMKTIEKKVKKILEFKD